MRKFQILFCIVLVLGFFNSCSSSPENHSTEELQAKPLETVDIVYGYKKLRVLDLDQMSDLMYEKQNEYKKKDSIQALREGALIAYSRPDSDSTRDKIISIVQSPLESANQWQPTVEGLVQQSIRLMNDDRATVDQQVTSGIVLENIIADLKPEFLKQYKTGGFETEMIQAIAGSQAMYSKAAQKERKLNLMRLTSSPKEIAQRLMDIKVEALKQTEK